MADAGLVVGTDRAADSGAGQFASARLSQPAGAEPLGDGGDLVGAAYRDAVERARCNRDLLVEFGASALPRVGEGRRVRRDLAPGAARVRPGGRDRLGVAGGRWRDDEGAP